MLVDFNFANRRVVVVGGGRMAERRARAFAEAGADVTVLSRDFSQGLRRLAEERLAEEGRVRLIEGEVGRGQSVGGVVAGADVVVAATDNPSLNAELVAAGRMAGALAYAVDHPDLSDFTFPATASAHGITVAVSTGGRSPLVAKILCDRLKASVGREDALLAEVQGYARGIAKRMIADRGARVGALRRIAGDPAIRDLLSRGRVDEAKALALAILEGRP